MMVHVKQGCRAQARTSNFRGHPDTSNFELDASTGKLAIDIAPMDKRAIGPDVAIMESTGIDWSLASHRLRAKRQDIFDTLRGEEITAQRRIASA